MKKQFRLILSVLLASILLASCSGIGGKGNKELTASGTIEAKSVNIAPEVGGTVSEVLVGEGEEVKAADILFKIDKRLIQIQYDQASSAVTAAEVDLEAAKIQLKNAELMHQIAVQNARIQNSSSLEKEWRKNQPSNFKLPVWYFSREENIETANALVEMTESGLKEKEKELQSVLADVKNKDFIALEKELGTDQTAYIVSDEALKKVRKASENKELVDEAEDNFELSKSQLENVQVKYDQALDTKAAEDVLKARAAVGAAQAKYDAAVNHLMSLFIGDNSIQVQSAETTVEQSEKAMSRAEVGLAQAKAALNSIEIQMEKTTVSSPISGIVLKKNMEKGELVNAGEIVMVIGNIDEVTLTVYIPEDKYGLVKINQNVVVEVDSFPGKTYPGTVSYISDTAEFTPSNVQTVEGRKSTVFAVKIKIPNSNHDLKPGMPADVKLLFE